MRATDTAAGRQTPSRSDVSMPLRKASCEGCAFTRLPEIKRRDWQDTVWLRTTAQRGKRSKAAHAVEKVPARPLEIGARQPRLGTDHVAEEVSPADLPQRRVHGAHGAIVPRRATLDPAERRQDAIEWKAQGVAQVLHVVVLENRGALNLEVETARVPGIVGAVSGPPIFGVVGRRARTDERQAVGIVMGIEKIGELVAVCATVSDRTTPNTTRLSRPAVMVAAAIGMRRAMPTRSASSKSVIHVMPASIAS